MESYPDWQWEAHYTDGSVLKQYDPTFHKFSEIQQHKLTSFHMVNPERAPIIIHWRPNLKLISFFHRVRQIKGERDETIRLYCLGYQDGYNKWIMVITPDGGIIITDDIEHIRVE